MKNKKKMQNKSAIDLVIREKHEVEFNISHVMTLNWKMNSYHFHDNYEIFYCLTDGIDYFANDKLYKLRYGDVFVFNRSDIHRSLPKSGMEYERFIIYFNPNYIRSISSEHTNLLECFEDREIDFENRIHIPEEMQMDFRELLDRAVHYQKSDMYGKDLLLKLLLCEILIFINNIYRNSKKSEETDEGQYNKSMQPIMYYIKNNLDKDLSLDHLSKKFFVSKYHLEYLFKKYTGFTITGYIISQKIIKAKKLLKEGRKVNIVSELSGFNSESHFSRTFKKHIGYSPKQYMKIINEQEKLGSITDKD